MSIEVDMVRKHATICQTVKEDKHHKRLTEPFKNGSRVLVRGRPYTLSPARSKRLEPRLFGPLKVPDHLPNTDNYKLVLLSPSLGQQKPYFHGGYLKE